MHYPPSPRLSRPNVTNFTPHSYHTSSAPAPRHSTNFMHTPNQNSMLHVPTNLTPLNHKTPLLERLSYDDIEKEFQKLSLEIPVDFWKSPKSEDVQGLFSKALEEIFLIKENDIRIEEVLGRVDQQFQGSEGMQLLSYDGKLHLRGIGNLRFFRYCQRLCWDILGVSSFNRDFLFKPTPHTTLTFATAFASFLRFREWIYQENTLLFDELEKKLREGEVFTQNISSLQNDLNNLESNLQEIQTEMKERKRLYDYWREKLNDVDILYSESKGQLDEIENTLKNLSNKENDISIQIRNIQSENDRLKNQIVPNPEQFLKTEKELSTKLQTAILSVNEYSEISQDFTYKLKMMEKAKKRLSKVESIINSQIEPIFQQSYTDRESLRVMKNQLNAIENSTTEYKKLFENYSKSVSTLRNDIRQKQIEGETKINFQNEEFEKLKIEHNTRRNSLQKLEVALKEMSDNSEKIIADTLSLEKQHHSVLESMDNQIKALLVCKEKFQNELDRLRKSFVLGQSENGDHEDNELDYSKMDSSLLETDTYIFKGKMNDKEEAWEDAEDSHSQELSELDGITPKRESFDENVPNLLNFRNIWKK